MVENIGLASDFYMDALFRVMASYEIRSKYV